MNGTDALRDLDPEQLQFLLRRLKKAGRKQGAEPGRQPIPRRRGPGPYPLSFAQQRLWFLHQVDPRSAAYHIPIGVDLAGDLRPSALQAALEGVVRRHEALRTTFLLHDGQPLQAVHEEVEIPLPQIDLSGLEAAAREAEAERLAGEEERRPFDLARGPLLRAAVLRLEPRRLRLVLVLHHVAADNWSVTILMREVSALYDGATLGYRPALPEPPVQYADYALWQRDRMGGEELEEQLAFWRRHLDGAPRRLDLPFDFPRPEVPSFRSGRLVFHLPEDLSYRLKALGRRHGTTLYNVLLAAFNALLHRYAGFDDVVVGSPVANRRRTELEGLIGFFVNTLLMRNRPAAAQSFAELLAAVHESSLGAYENQDLPFERIVEDLKPERDSSYQPLFQVMFNVYDVPMPELRFAGLEVGRVDVRIGTWNDLDLLLVEAGHGIEGYLRYSADLFEEATVRALADSYAGLLEQVVRAPDIRDIRLAGLALTPALALQAEAARRRERRQRIAVAATFTAEPLEDTLAFWMKELDLPSEVAFAPYNQVFQQLLDPASLLSANRHGVNLVLVRFEDWSRGEDLERVAGDFAKALEQAARRAAIPFLVMICPASPAAMAAMTAMTATVDAAFQALCGELEGRLRAAWSDLPGVHVISADELAARYPLDPPGDLHDPYTDQIGHVPYSPVGFAALGTLLARKVHALVSPPAKVIVLDCDNTLWQGVCGEDGPLGVVLDPARRFLQEAVVAQQAEGMLVCLCSKNQEEDVWAVFDRRPGFPLWREHLTAWRINWRPKSENLRSLAAELGVGLDSFVFLDDNPVECAEVRAACPQVLVLELPAEIGNLPRMLEHCWAFDRLRTTAEDRERTALYRQMLERERHRRSASSFEEFLAGLELEVDVAPLLPADLPRASQLTLRTNQFNASTIRRGELEIQRLLDVGDAGEGGALEGRVVRVRDRFGDYGLVGVVLFGAGEPPGEALAVDTFLLSCRVLGRGVEHRILARLGEEARKRGLARVDVRAVPTARNRPAFDFLREVAGSYEEAAAEGGSVFRIPLDVALVARFSPREKDPRDKRDIKDGRTAPAGSPGRARRLARIAAELFDAREILRRVEAGRSRGRAGEKAVAPRNATEERLAAIFAEVLGLPAGSVGALDSFFELGGHSLLGTVVLSRVRDAFAVELPVHRLFQAPTVETLAGLVEEEKGKSAPAAFEPILRISAPELDLIPEPAVDVAALSEAEVQALLGRLLKEGGVPA